MSEIRIRIETVRAVVRAVRRADVLAVAARAVVDAVLVELLREHETLLRSRAAGAMR
ncbi:hypothetical protein [Nocardia farcinica]|uniref:hypothetical protein n=1 Tax=Nocardia farcinica TaxID=37329 RepID=UPI00245419F4|nr:hypothetical protein [Nocardia farcinica]